MSAAIPASPGYFVITPGSSSQTPAAIGKYVPGSGAASQINAPPGSYAPITGMSAAIPAPAGTYSPSVGSATVLPVPAGFTTTGAGASSIIPLPQIGITAYQLQANGDNTLTFPTDSGQNYAIYYSENLVDFTLIVTVPGDGNPATRTFTPPASTTGKRFFVVARLTNP
jgi:hypothetical protein